MGMGSLGLWYFVFYLAGIGGIIVVAGNEDEIGGYQEPISEIRRPGFLYTRTTARCTPQYWSSGREAWPNTIPEESSISKVFGSRVLERYESRMTLLEATQRNDDDVGGNIFNKLLKQSTAALLNAYARPGFPYSAWEVKSLLIEALVSEDAAASQAEHFARANSVCP